MNDNYTKNAIEAVIRIGLLLLLLVWCFNIVQPFIVPVVWAVIISVAVYPLFIKLKDVLGGRNKTATVIYTIFALALLITPTVMISDSIIDTSKTISEKYDASSLVIPAPKENVKEWPLLGEQAYSAWLQASENIDVLLEKYQGEIKQLAKAVVATAAGVAMTTFQFILSIIISGLFMANAAPANAVTIKLFSRLTTNESGESFVKLSKDTIRSVAQGVLGVAIIQALLAAVGMIVMDVPAWGLWTLFVLVVAIAQLPAMLVLGFVCAYVFYVGETMPAIIFLVYCFIVSSVDTFLKPIFLGRGMETPMLVILLGAIGGMLMSGIIGLFVGAIVLALGYELFMDWLNKESVTS